MDIKIEWQKPIQLTRNKLIIVDENDLPARLASRAGVYFFARRFGKVWVPFYIGESQNVRVRLRQHLGTKKIADVLRSIASSDDEIKNGARYFHFGYFVAKKGQQPKPCLDIVQRHLIRQAVEEGHAILNSQLKKFRVHNLTFEGSVAARSIYEKTSVVEA